jgi:hypothetical protein
MLIFTALKGLMILTYWHRRPGLRPFSKNTGVNMDPVCCGQVKTDTFFKPLPMSFLARPYTGTKKRKLVKFRPLWRPDFFFYGTSLLYSRFDLFTQFPN